MLIGVGRFGSQVLEDLSRQLAHAYGPQLLKHVPLLTIGFSPHGFGHRLPYYSVYEDVSDWLNKPDVTTRALGYQAPPPYDLCAIGNEALSPDRLNEIEHRRLARLVFLKHLSRQRLRLETYFQKRATEFKPAEIEGGSVHIYLLAGLEDLEGNTLLLDLAAVLQTALRKPRPLSLRIFAFLALPSALHHAADRLSSRVMANVYGCLRELEQARLGRYVPSPYHQGPLTHPLIDFVRLYDTPPHIPQGALEAFFRVQWADALLPQLDHTFGTRFAQEHWVNLPNLENDRGNGEEMFVGAQQAYTVVFPRDDLRRYWRESLALEALHQHIRPDADEDVWRSVLERWGKRQLSLVDDENNDVSTPRLVSHLLFRPHPATPLQAPLYHWAEWLCAQDDPQQEHILKMLPQAIIGWKAGPPYIYISENTSPASLCHAVEKQLERFFGPSVTKNGQVETSGTYTQLLEQVAVQQNQSIQRSILALTRYALAHIGLVPTVHMLAQLSKQIKRAQQELPENWRLVQERLSSEVAHMQRTCRRLDTVMKKRFFGRSTSLTQQASDYLASATRVFLAASDIVAIERLIWITNALSETVDQLSAETQRWQDMFWYPGAPLTLYQQIETREAEYQAALWQDDFRYVLLDPAWVQKTSRQLLSQYVPHLASQLTWHVQSAPQKDSASPHITVTPWLNDTPFHLLRRESSLMFNTRRWREAANMLIEQEVAYMTLWDYLAGQQEVILPEMVQALGQSRTLLDYATPGTLTANTALRVHFLLKPDRVTAQAAQQGFLEKLRERIVADTNLPLQSVPFESETHIIHWSNVDLVPLRETRGYHHARNAYQELSPSERLSVFAFAREATAAWLENELHRIQWPRPDSPLPTQIVNLLEFWPALQRFVWIDAFDWLKTRPAQDMIRYVLTIPTHEGTLNIPLGEPAAQLEMFQAVQSFCTLLNTGEQTENDPVLTQAQLDEAITSHIQEHAQREGIPHTNAPYWVWVKDLQRRQRAWPWALYQGWRAQLMEDYHRQQQQRAPRSDMERDLYAVLAYIAHVNADRCKTALQEKMRF